MEDIKVGDMVKVVRKAKGGEMVNCYWDSRMDNMIGGFYKVDQVDFTFSTCNINGYRFPIGCCEKVSSNEVIMSKYSYKGVTYFDRIIEDNKDELAFIIKGDKDCIVGLDKRIQSKYATYEYSVFYEKNNNFYFKRYAHNTNFNFGIFPTTRFDDVKAEILRLIKEFKSRTVKKVYTFK